MDHSQIVYPGFHISISAGLIGIADVTVGPVSSNWMLLSPSATCRCCCCPQLDKLVNALSGRTLLTGRICFEYRPPLCRNRVVERCSLTLVRVAASNAKETFHSSEINLLLLIVGPMPGCWIISCCRQRIKFSR